MPVRLFLAFLTVLIIIGFDRELVSSFENKSFKILCEPDGVKEYVGTDVLETGTDTSFLSTHQSLSLSVCRHGGSAQQATDLLLLDGQLVWVRSMSTNMDSGKHECLP